MKARTTRPGSFKAPKPLPGDVPYSPPFEYVCSGGHHLGAEHEIPECPVFVRNVLCTGTLTRVGVGSGRGRKVIAS